MAEVLSADEIDALLNAISGSSSGSAASGSASSAPTDGASGDSSSGSESEPRRRFKVYDWRRPDRFTKRQIRAISKISERFTREVSTSLERETGCGFSIHVASIDQLLYEEFIRSIPAPSFIASVLMDPLPGMAVFEIDPLLAGVLVSACHGMKSESVGDVAPSIKNGDRLFLEGSITRDALETILVGMFANLRESWAPVLDLKPRLSSIEKSPTLCDFMPSGETIVLVTIEVTLSGEDLGMLNVVYPWNTLDSLLPMLERFASGGSADRMPGGKTVAASVDHLRAVRNLTGSRPVTVSGEYLLDCAPLSSAELGAALAQTSSGAQPLRVADREPFDITYRVLEDRDHV